MLRRSIRWSCVPAALLSLAFAASAQGRTELLVYTALEADQVQAYKAAFEKENPSVELKFVRDSTGIVTAKLLAEKANPQADVVWGLAATSLMLLDKEGMLQPYAPKGLDAIRPSASTRPKPPRRTCPSPPAGPT